jgi:predicted NBD/HSP70 family sugar kinase
LTPNEILKRSETGDETAEAALRRYEKRLAKALASVMNILDPEVVVLGGGLSNIDRLYLNVPELWREFVFSDTVRTRLVKAEHGDSSGVRGAAWLWPEGGAT